MRLVDRYLDQLGNAATTGHGAMCRQCLVGGNYSLLGNNEKKDKRKEKKAKKTTHTQKGDFSTSANYFHIFLFFL